MRNDLFNTGQSMTLLSGASYTLLAGEVGINGVVYDPRDIELIVQDRNPKATAQNVINLSAGELSIALTNNVRVGVRKLAGLQDMPARFGKYDDWYIDGTQQATLTACITNIEAIILKNENSKSYVENLTLGATHNINWYKDVHFLTMDEACAFSEINLPASGVASKKITLYVSGNFVPTWPIAWDDNFTPIGAYVGTKLNKIEITFVKTGWYWVVITQDT